MDLSAGSLDSVHRVKLDASGRIVLPSDVRHQLGVNEGDSVLVVGNNNAFRIQTAANALQEAQDYFSSFVPPDVSLVDEILIEHREEAARE